MVNQSLDLLFGLELISQEDYLMAMAHSGSLQAWEQLPQDLWVRLWRAYNLMEFDPLEQGSTMH